jgi:hypothetical protein
MEEVDAPCHRLAHAVGDVDHDGHVAWHHQMLIGR